MKPPFPGCLSPIEKQDIPAAALSPAWDGGARVLPLPSSSRQLRAQRSRRAPAAGAGAPGQAGTTFPSTPQGERKDRAGREGKGKEKDRAGREGPGDLPGLLGAGDAAGGTCSFWGDFAGCGRGRSSCKMLQGCKRVLGNRGLFLRLRLSLLSRVWEEPGGLQRGPGQERDGFLTANRERPPLPAGSTLVRNVTNGARSPCNVVVQIVTICNQTHRSRG